MRWKRSPFRILNRGHDVGQTRKTADPRYGVMNSTLVFQAYDTNKMADPGQVASVSAAAIAPLTPQVIQELLNKKNKRKQPSLLGTIKLTFVAMHQIEQRWKKTEKLLGAHSARR